MRHDALMRSEIDLLQTASRLAIEYASTIDDRLTAPSPEALTSLNTFDLPPM